MPELSPRPSNPPVSLQDVMCASLAGLIALVALGLLICCYCGASAAGDVHFKNEKDVLAMAIGLLGFVTGYYFGRAPVERQAQQATRYADMLLVQLERAQDQLAERGLRDNTVL